MNVESDAGLACVRSNANEASGPIGQGFGHRDDDPEFAAGLSIDELETREISVLQGTRRAREIELPAQVGVRVVSSVAGRAVGASTN